MSVEDYDFESGDAGAELSFAQEAGQIRVGGYMVMKGNIPCKVSDVSTSKTGKHGHAKCNFTAIGIFNGKKYEDIIPSTHTAHVPFVKRNEYVITDIGDDEFVTLMDDNGTQREDIKLPTFPDNMAKEMKEAHAKGASLLCTVMSAMGTEQIIAWKEEN
eukprot:TRINITY_DN8699_c0_g1_i1.p1 TRINITY_DN8699_c0_g1~~TRINITY_DN8699_c0_g1_i1.p1  ORF type:complete len:159 (-),score=18.11 TRINITY_DN8699_c0_g1_i1:69-545(-)